MNYKELDIKAFDISKKYKHYENSLLEVIIQIDETKASMTQKQEKYLQNFAKNLREGINYYHQLFNDFKDRFTDSKSTILNDLETSKIALNRLNEEIEKPVEINA